MYKYCLTFLLTLVMLISSACGSLQSVSTPAPPTDVPTAIPEAPVSAPTEASSSIEVTSGSRGAEVETDFPILDEPTMMTVIEADGDTVVTYNSNRAFDDVVAFYKDRMAAGGWQLSSDLVVAGTTANLDFARADDGANITITSLGALGEINVVITYASGTSFSTGGVEPTTAPVEPTSALTTEPTSPPAATPVPTAEPSSSTPCEPSSGRDSSGGSQLQPNYQGQDLQCANFAATELFQPNFSYANLFRAIFDDAEVHQGVFVGAYMGGVRFDLAELYGPDFTNVNLTGASFANVEMTDPNFSGANLGGANFTSVIMTGAVWDNTICPDGQNSNDVGGTCEGHF
jgi:hypothetical protein